MASSGCRNSLKIAIFQVGLQVTGRFRGKSIRPTAVRSA